MNEYRILNYATKIKRAIDAGAPLVTQCYAMCRSAATRSAIGGWVENMRPKKLGVLPKGELKYRCAVASAARVRGVPSAAIFSRGQNFLGYWAIKMETLRYWLRPYCKYVNRTSKAV